MHSNDVQRDRSSARLRASGVSCPARLCGVCAPAPVTSRVERMGPNDSDLETQAPHTTDECATRRSSHVRGLTTTGSRSAHIHTQQRNHSHMTNQTALDKTFAGKHIARAHESLASVSFSHAIVRHRQMRTLRAILAFGHDTVQSTRDSETRGQRARSKRASVHPLNRRAASLFSPNLNSPKILTASHVDGLQ